MLKIIELKLRIKEVPQLRGQKMKDIAEKVGMDQTYLGRINSGNVSPNLSVLQRIADVMEVPVQELIYAPENYGHFYIDGTWEGIRRR